MTWGSTCKDDVAGVEETCCPLGKKMIGCMGADCMKLSMAMEKVEGKSLEDYEKMGKSCPDAGMPATADVEAEVEAAKTVGAPESATPATTDFAAPGQVMSALAMVAAVVALFA